jgi:LPXTG-motif cell wall-anchored protein
MLIVALALLAGAKTVVAAGSNRPVFEGWQTMAILRGTEVVPRPGDPDGNGAADVYLGGAPDEVCFALRASNITLPAVAAHIHRGAGSTSGPVVASLPAPGADGVVSGCVKADAAVLSAINANPADFYVQIDTADYPAGALRGQLARVAALSRPATLDAPTVIPNAAPATPATMPNTGQSGDGGPLLAGLALLALLVGSALRRKTHARSEHPARKLE